ncbi:MAG: hypothetical protein M3N29_02020 [Chloroflexota bacterium]|nr:hypothetical protein [Chloroflexota bacterium]
MKFAIDALASIAAGVPAGDNDWDGDANGDGSGEGRTVATAPAVDDAPAVARVVAGTGVIGADNPAGVAAGEGDTLAAPQAAVASAADKRRTVALIT